MDVRGEPRGQHDSNIADVFISVDDKRVRLRPSPIGIVAALPNAIGLASPQTILGFLFGQIHDKNDRRNLAATTINRNKCRSPRSRSAAARELDPERCANSALALDDRLLDFPTGLVDNEPNAKMPSLAVILHSFPPRKVDNHF
jgi:hypothetical protein